MCGVSVCQVPVRLCVLSTRGYVRQNPPPTFCLHPLGPHEQVMRKRGGQLTARPKSTVLLTTKIQSALLPVFRLFLLSCRPVRIGGVTSAVASIPFLGDVVR